MISDIATALFHNLYVAGVRLTDGQILLGEEYVHQESTPPRIVMVPRTGEWGPPSASSLPTPGRAGAASGVYKPIASRHVAIETHVWGEDYDHTEALMHALLVAAHDAAANVLEITSEEWVTTSELGKLGREAVCMFIAQIPVTRAAYPYVDGGSITAVNKGEIIIGETPEAACGGS